MCLLQVRSIHPGHSSFKRQKLPTSNVFVEPVAFHRIFLCVGPLKFLSASWHIRCSTCSLNKFVAWLLHVVVFQDVRQRNRSPNSLESVSSSTDSAYSETASSPASSSGDERLLDDVDEEYSSGGYKYSYYEIATHLSSLNFSWNGILEVSILKCVFFDFWLFF